LSEAGDTLRILELCNVDNKFSAGAKVKINPESVPSFRIDIIPEDPEACSLMNSYLGKLTKLQD